MTHPRGNLHYQPYEKFACVRPYMKGLDMHFASGVTWTQSGSEFTFLYAPQPLYRAYIKFRDDFWYGAQNVYTLDYIIEWNYEVVTPGALEQTFFLGVAFTWLYDGDKPGVDLTGVSPAVDSSTPLPPYPRNYWSPL